jgi:hypothetical protein
MQSKLNVGSNGILRRSALATLALGGSAFAILSREARTQESLINIAIGQRGNWARMPASSSDTASR